MLIAFRFGDTRALSRFICWWQDSDASHCECVIRRVADNFECVSASWVDGGVRRKVMPLAAEKWRIYEMPGSTKKAAAWADLHEDERYDLLGLLGFVFRRVKGWLKAWFCSEACADILGLREPWRYDVATLESVCAAVGRRVQ